MPTKENDLIRLGDPLSKSSTAGLSGQIVSVDGADVIIRKGRPT